MNPTLLISGEKVLVQGQHQALVESKSTPGDYHSVTFDTEDGWHCTCKGFQVRKSCRHVTVVRGWYVGSVKAEVMSDETDTDQA